MADPAPPPTDAVAGLVLAGGRGSRMGGVDKGLQMLDGTPLARHALRRLAPQVATAMVSANRHADTYAGWGVPVLADADATGFDGPLAGLLAGLRHSALPWLAAVPCDTPFFPQDLVVRLADAATAANAPAACAWAPDAADGTWRAQPVFCLLHRSLQADLAAYLAGGGRRVMEWLGRHGCAQARFDAAAAFRNANTAEDLAALQADARLQLSFR